MDAFTATCDFINSVVDDFTSPTKMAIDNAADSISSAIESANFSSRWQLHDSLSSQPTQTTQLYGNYRADGYGDSNDIALFSLIIKAVALITYIVVVCKLTHYFIFAPSVSSLIVLCGVVGSLFIYFILKARRLSK